MSLNQNNFRYFHQAKGFSSELFSPTYWGSLLALMLGVAYTMVASVRSGPPPHVLTLKEAGLALPLFYGSLIFVSLFTVRYFFAVCANIYGETGEAVLKWPKGTPRVIGFSLLCALVVLAVSSIGTVIAFGISAAIYICRIMAFTSLIIFCASWLLHRENKEKYGSVPIAFGLGDVSLIALTWWLLSSISKGPSENTVIGLFVIIAMMVIFVTVEFRRRFWPAFRKQFDKLVTELYK